MVELKQTDKCGRNNTLLSACIFMHFKIYTLASVSDTVCCWYSDGCSSVSHTCDLWKCSSSHAWAEDCSPGTVRHITAAESSWRLPQWTAAVFTWTNRHRKRERGGGIQTIYSKHLYRLLKSGRTGQLSTVLSKKKTLLRFFTDLCVKMCSMPEMSGGGGRGRLCTVISELCRLYTRSQKQFYYDNYLLWLPLRGSFAGAAGSDDWVCRKENTLGWISVFPFRHIQSIHFKVSMVELWVSPCKTGNPFFTTDRTARSFKWNFPGLKRRRPGYFKIFLFTL